MPPRFWGSRIETEKGSGGHGTAVPPLASPNPSPQGGREDFAAPSQRKLPPIEATLVVASIATCAGNGRPLHIAMLVNAPLSPSRCCDPLDWRNNQGIPDERTRTLPDCWLAARGLTTLRGTIHAPTSSHGVMAARGKPFMEHLKQTAPYVRSTVWRAMSHRLRLALEVLAHAGEHGSTDSSFFSRFTFELLDLVGSGFATAEREVVRSGQRPVEIVRVRITEEGRRVVGERADLNQH